jgi:hypothetical protein
MQRLSEQLWLINPKDLASQDAERVTKAFVQLLSLAGLAQYDGVLIQWLYEYEAHKPKKSAPALWDFASPG